MQVQWATMSAGWAAGKADHRASRHLHEPQTRPRTSTFHGAERKPGDPHVHDAQPEGNQLEDPPTKDSVLGCQVNIRVKGTLEGSQGERGTHNCPSPDAPTQGKPLPQTSSELPLISRPGYELTLCSLHTCTCDISTQSYRSRAARDIPHCSWSDPCLHPHVKVTPQHAELLELLQIKHRVGWRTGQIPFPLSVCLPRTPVHTSKRC